ncbi:methyltransferase domain-containing protein [Virgisporangium aurantiacum]|uniref:Methyltransferase domain-containing protein n=1 Tax=Virgisporangium aurantiacum TaxID=175570 RepID=A0A8J4E5I0_9ACTN|nr:methyltransferase domain-containing protein [Virgisporangium aurantiacum]GIJ62124.1 hypothetical protein Vau01_096400 [Virgisporangium aurantiacum]
MTLSTTYALDNDQQGASTSLAWLAQVLDPHTMRILQPLVRPGSRVLELGAGTGTIARKLADIVIHEPVTAATDDDVLAPLPTGPRGLVVATDLKPIHVQPTHPGVRVEKHDLRIHPVTAIKGGPWDLIHLRCVMAHLGNRNELIAELAAALAPGGHLVIEEWGGVGAGMVLRAPTDQTEVLYSAYQQALRNYFTDYGNDGTWILRAYRLMVEAGLEAEVQTGAKSWVGGKAGCRLPIAMSEQIEDQLIAQGMTLDDLQKLRTHLVDPAVTVMGNQTWSFIGRRPIAEG